MRTAEEEEEEEEEKKTMTTFCLIFAPCRLTLEAVRTILFSPILSMAPRLPAVLISSPSVAWLQNYNWLKIGIFRSQ